MITENLSTLKIHKLSQEQYDRELAAGRIDENAIYLTPDERAEQVQSNWAQNDPTAVDFIRGRTHGAIWSEGEVGKGTFAYDMTNDLFVGTPTFLVSAYMFCLGEKYKITLNGQEFESVLYKHGNRYFFGNLGAMTSLYPNTGEPFVFIFSPQENILRLLSMGELGVPLDTPFEFSVYGKFVPSSFEGLDIAPEDLVMTLQEQYLPSNIRELPEEIVDISNTLDNIESRMKEYVSYEAQTLTKAQKTQARTNIGAVSLEDIPVFQQVQADLSETDELSPAFVKGILREESIPASIPSVGRDFYCDSYSTYDLNWTSADNGMYFAQIDYTEDSKNQLSQMITSEDGIGYSFNFTNPVGYTFQPLFLEYAGDGEILVNREGTMIVILGNPNLWVCLYSSSMPQYTTISFGQLKTYLAVTRHRELHPSIIPSFVARKSDVSEAIETLRESLDNLASKTYVDNSIASLVNSAPEALDTLGELAAAMEENDGVVNALNQAIANKADNSTVTQLQETVNAKAENSALNEHTSNTTIHITAVERAAWNSKMDSDSELISIADIDAICGSVIPIAEVLF